MLNSALGTNPRFPDCSRLSTRFSHVFLPRQNPADKDDETLLAGTPFGVALPGKFIVGNDFTRLTGLNWRKMESRAMLRASMY